jgi:DMSO/TMAO reductase YedYZ molybdopterin-dependent catalytic subunit
MAHPLRLRTSIKLGYNNAKWIKAIEVTNDFRKPIGASAAKTGTQGFRRTQTSHRSRFPARLLGGCGSAS